MSRDDLLRVRLTADERAQIEQNASASGLTTSAYVRHALIASAAPKPVEIVLAGDGDNPYESGTATR